LRLGLVAASLPWWQNISGWDLRHRRPKDTRRAVPAGATYWFEVIEGDASALWLQPLSDAEQDRRDGFGLALVRPWQP
jgi:CRISPR-associated protein Cmr3